MKIKGDLLKRNNNFEFKQIEEVEEGNIKVNLGCGNYKLDGFINVDLSPLCKPDKVMDLNNKWEFEDNSVDFVYGIGIIEHVKEIDFFMEELSRILKKGGKAVIIAPYYNSVLSVYDPQHRWFFCENILNAYDTRCHLNYYSKARFNILSIAMKRMSYWSFFIPKFMRLNLSKILGNLYGEMVFVLEKV